MRRITKENISREIAHLLDEAPMSCGNLEKFVLLCKAMKYLSQVHREFTEDDAREWISHMDPPARWTMEQTTSVMNQRGYHHKPCEFWAVMNMLVSDYGAVAAKYGADKPEFWADMADAFIRDGDAEEGKVGQYWRDIVRHE